MSELLITCLDVYKRQVSILLTVGITMLPGINHIFHLTALNLRQWLIVFGLSFLIIPLVEMIKLFTTFKKAST